jgi:hypothetical protein
VFRFLIKFSNLIKLPLDLLQEVNDEKDPSKKGPPPGVVTTSIQKRIIQLFEQGSSPDQIALESIVKEVHLTEKEVGCIIEEYDAVKVRFPRFILFIVFCITLCLILP